MGERKADTYVAQYNTYTYIQYNTHKKVNTYADQSQRVSCMYV